MNEIKKLALGTVQFGLDYGINNKAGQVLKEEIKRILQQAQKSGIQFIDTAQAYGNSETVLGECMVETNSQFSIVTKISKDNTARLFDSMTDSLQRLQQPAIAGVLYHSFDAYFSNQQSIDELYKLKALGLVTNIGFSLYLPSELEFILSQNIAFDFLQIPFNIYDRRFAPYFSLLKEKGIRIFTRSAFLQGLVFIKPENLHPFFSNLKHKQQLLHHNASELGVSIASFCLQFCLCQQLIDNVVIGVDNNENLTNNIQSIADVEKVRAIIDTLDTLSETDEQILLPYNWKLS